MVTKIDTEIMHFNPRLIYLSWLSLSLVKLN